MMQRLRAWFARAPIIEQKLTLPKSEITHFYEASRAEFTDLHALADALGIQIRRCAFKSTISGGIQEKGCSWVISVNEKDSLERQRFTIAHELGHYMLHRDLLVKRDGAAGVFDTHGYRQPEFESLLNPFIFESHERQATRLAISLLMRKEKMLILLGEDHSIDELSRRIGCTPKATAIRIRSIQPQSSSILHPNTSDCQAAASVPILARS